MTYDAIVIGLGGMGSATVAHLAKRGYRALGLDANRRLHALGSSHGDGRIIREAYFEAPQYVPLVQRAYQLWRELEAESGRDLLTITGGLNFGTPDSEFVSGSIASAVEHGLPYELLDHRQVAERFPGFRLSDDLVAVYEPNAGILRPEACVDAHLDLAAKHGADLRFEQAARRWSADGDGVRVETDAGTFAADCLIVTAGPWSGEVLRALDLPLEAWRIVNVHFASSTPEPFAVDRCPVYLFQVPEGDYYGFPYVPGQGVKIGRHDIGEVCTPATIRRDIDAAEIEMLRAALDRYLPGASGPVIKTLTCMYTNTPDRHFILDTVAGQENVVYGCGFSGHGFKFASAIGETLAELAMEGSTRCDIGFLSAGRAAIREASTSSVS
ncbi:MAG TPA: N-methyl-L-tryptophan oxidase [Thermomicrobiales bacterium]|nr:N-methyl-L-tryptophan oxidase [Thermomicrobiales bacterium]